MHRLSLLFLLFAIPLLACSSGTGAGSANCDSGCVDYSAVKTAPAFTKDVIPIFQLSCNFSPCHLNGAAAQEGLQLGRGTVCDMAGKCTADPMTAAEITAVHDGIVNATAKRSNLKVVVPGDPANSWLMAKLSYGDLCACPALKGTCKPKGCGERMPQNNPPLEPARLDVITGWIKNGAKND